MGFLLGTTSSHEGLSLNVFLKIDGNARSHQKTRLIFLGTLTDSCILKRWRRLEICYYLSKSLLVIRSFSVQNMDHSLIHSFYHQLRRIFSSLRVIDFYRPERHCFTSSKSHQLLSPHRSVSKF